MKTLLISLLVIFPYINYAQYISTVAGGGTSPGTDGIGDGVHADSAELSDPANVIFDMIGNLYIDDALHNRIRKVDTTGIITTYAGNGSAGYYGDGKLADSSEFSAYGLGKIVVDVHRNLYITDANNYRVRIVKAISDTITTFAGNGISGFSGDSGLATVAQVEPGHIAIDKNGYIYIADAGNRRIRKVDTFGIITTYAGNGTSGFSGDGGPANADSVEFSSQILGLACDTFGNLYIADRFNYRIRKIDASTNVISTIAGFGSGGYVSTGISALLEGFVPGGLAIDAYQNLYIADFVNMRILKDTAGIIYSIAGNGISGYSGDGGLADTTELRQPYDVCFDPCGNLYIADAGNQRIRKVTIPPKPLTNSITANTSDTVCAGTLVNYTSIIANGGTSLSYKWYVNGSMVTSTGSSYAYTPANGDSVRCACTSISVCTGTVTASSNTIRMVVNPVSVPTITVSAPVAAPIGSTVSVTATVSGAGSSYSIRWYDEGVLFATTTTPATSYIKTHVLDTITARVVSTAVGCYDSATSAAWVVRDTGLSTTSPSPLQRGNFICYPNPVVDYLTIQHLGYSVTDEIVVCDVLGRVVYRGSMRGDTKVIDVSGWVRGVYVLTLTPQHTPDPSQEGNSGEGDRVRIKIVKE